MQTTANKRLATAGDRENRFPSDAFWEMGIYSGAKTTGFAVWAQIQFSHRWVNWESILPSAIQAYRGRKSSLAISLRADILRRYAIPIFW
ncbi:hypothetical protein Pan181_35500 [Aeoliella mucimassa]|uniref:Uncharacterized protein n=1 Tax=Aeoliella mucimassa TaxID=2527972 RepID=A0A518ARI9_9BACT|nr:hypothetical protein Pan181_35500 [Aeoliella mucimassa]